MRVTDVLSALAVASLAATVAACNAALPAAPSAALSSAGDSLGGRAPSVPTVEVRCESRDSRSKVSVDGKNLAAGSYSATITSGANVASAPAKNTIGDEVDFDFDSDRGNIARGATPISGTFIQDGTVTGQILNGATVVASATAACKVQ